VTGVCYIDQGLRRIAWAIFGAGCLAKAMQRGGVCILVGLEMWWHEQQAKPAALGYVFLPRLPDARYAARRSSLAIGLR
jgi:hypothetical protein